MNPENPDAKVCLVSGDPVEGDFREINTFTGQQKDYIVLHPDERAKGFVRPFRNTYKHLKCGINTTMSKPLAETYARDPAFYQGTFCATCRGHYPLDEFQWLDGTQVGS